jgi:hypothetical protein
MLPDHFLAFFSSFSSFYFLPQCWVIPSTCSVLDAAVPLFSLAESAKILAEHTIDLAPLSQKRKIVCA